MPDNDSEIDFLSTHTPSSRRKSIGSRRESAASRRESAGSRRESAPDLLLHIDGPDQSPTRRSTAGRRRSQHGHSLSQIAEDVRRRMQAINGFKLSTTKSLQLRGPPLPNTYQLEPSDDGRFRSGVVTRMTQEILEEALKRFSNYEQISGVFSCTIAELVKNAVKTLCPRHKVICHVMLMEDCNQGSQSVTRCLWNTDVDNMAVVTYVKNDLNVTVTVYGIYQE